MTKWLLHLVLLFLVFVTDVCSQCTQFSDCKTCAGQIDANFKCRWCFASSSCVASKYQCHPKKSVLHWVNCPLPTPGNYNDTFNRNEIAYYVHAANRVSHWSPIGAVRIFPAQGDNQVVGSQPMSCLAKLNANVEILNELEVPTTFEDRDIGILIAANHDRKHVVLGFRSTNDIVQFMTQGIVYALGMMEDFPLGGKMVTYYARAYHDILAFGFDDYIKKALQKYPDYYLLVVGHSLGGALANIFALHCSMILGRKDVVLYSWEAPRSGDEAFAELHRQHVNVSFRVARDGDFIVDLPFRISDTLPSPHHNSFEVFYQSHMIAENFQICNQPETEYCLKGQWYKKPTAHMFLFDQNYWNYRPGFCE